MARLERLTEKILGEALTFLALDPYQNVYVAWLIGTGQVERGSGTVLVSRDRGGALQGLCYYGPQFVPYVRADAEPIALEAFAEYVRVSGRPRMIVGPKAVIDAFWTFARPIVGEPEIVRATQPVYALTRATLRGGRRDAIVDRATRAELDEIVPHSARMIEGEIGADPRLTNADFRGRTGRIIDAGWWWRYRVLGKLAFMCNVGSASSETAQLQGVWSPPDMRGHGHSARGLAAICDHLLDDHPSLCLYVNDFNTSAIALYERVGFKRVGEFKTFIF